MELETATRLFEALSSGVRLKVFRLLVQAGSSGMVAGKIAETLDLPATNLSFHLKALAQAGLIRADQEGRFQRYRANIALMSYLIGYLTEECCGGDLSQCGDLGAMCAGLERPPSPGRS